MESVGRATARRWFSYTQNRQTESKIKKNYRRRDRHKAPGRICSAGKHEKTFKGK